MNDDPGHKAAEEKIQKEQDERYGKMADDAVDKASDKSKTDDGK